MGEAARSLDDVSDHLGEVLRRADELLAEWSRFGAEVRTQVDREVAANAANNKHDFLVALDRAVKERAEEERKAAEEEASGHPAGLRPAASPGGLRMVQRADA